MSQFTTIQYAWAIYFAGSLGCTVAAWWMFLWAWRFVRYAAVVTVMTFLFTPYAIDAQTMTMAPAIYTLVFEGISQGPQAIMPLVKVMLGIWIIGLIMVLVFVVLTRKPTLTTSPRISPRRTGSPSSRALRPVEHHGGRRHEHPVKSANPRRGLSKDEFQAREELLSGEVPIRAIRD